MTTIEGYGELARIGAGGLGDVYRATRSSTGDVVAIKILRDISDHSVAWHRTRRELTALVALAGHEHVIQLLAVLDLTDGPALVMEYAPGGSVADLLRRRGDTLDIGEAVLIGRHTAAALVGAHARGIVHRDVKPQNLLIDASGQIRLCDFGVAALTRSEEFRTRTSALSMRYASPEDLDDEADVGPPTDVYSIGATLLHLVHGAPPSLKDRLAPWQPPDVTDPDVAALDAILSDCLQPDPDRRPTASEVRDRLDHLDRSLGDRRRHVIVGEEPTASPPSDLRPSAEPRARPDRDHAGSTTIADPDTDTTIRPDQVRPDRHRGSPTPVPPPHRDRSRWPVVGALVGVAAIATAALLWSIDDGPHEVTGATRDPATIDQSSGLTAAEPLSTVDRPTGLAPIDDPTIVWPFGRPGDCLVQRPTVDELVTVACTEPHDLQRYARATLGRFGTDASYDAEAVRDEVRLACDRAFEPFVGTPDDESTLDVAFTHPSATTWADGDRQYQCFVGVPGSRVIGDATGSGP